MSDQAIKHSDAVKWANYILEHSDKPEGMVQRWREQAIDRTATWIMLNNLKQRYEEMVGEKK